MHHQRLLGTCLAVLTGMLGGLILAPMEYVGYECKGLPYIPAMAAGVALSAPLVTYLVHWQWVHKVRGPAVTTVAQLVVAVLVNKPSS